MAVECNHVHLVLILCIFTTLTIMGKRFGDAGLIDVAVESGVIADGSIAGVLDGRKYNRAIRLHKLML